VILNSTAGMAFDLIGRSTVEHLLVQLARLTDHETTGKHRHLCLGSLITEVRRALAETTRRIPDPYPPTPVVAPRVERDQQFLNEIDCLCVKLAPI
jgi:hypothetical protein